jgi:integrase
VGGTCSKCGIRRAGGAWWYRFRFGGRIIHESAKTQSKTVAREAAKQRRRQLEESWNGIKKRALPPTFERAAREWLDNRHSIEASTRETYQHALKHLVAFFGNALICDIDAPDVTAYKDHRSAEGAAGATVKKEFTILACILADHGQWHKIRRKVKSPDENKSAGRALLQDEEMKLLQAASEVGLKQGHWSPIYTVAVLGLNTGLRHSEVRKLRWQRVDMIRRVLVAGVKTDAGKDRPVPLTQPAWAALDVWASRFPNRKPSDYCFPACQNGNIDSSRPITHWRTAWQRACQLAGLAGLRYHDLRHSAVTKMLENGVPMATIAQILGWSPSTTIRMTKRYGHIRPDAQRQALEGIAVGLPSQKAPVFEGGVHQNGNQVAVSLNQDSGLTN